MIFIKLLLTAFFWGGTFIAGKIVAQHAGPFSAAFIRFTVATLILCGLCHYREGLKFRFNRMELLAIILLGLTGICFYNVFFFCGLKRINAGRAALIIATNPIFTTLLAAYFFKETIGYLKSFGIMLSMTGAIIVITNGRLSAVLEQGIGAGEWFILGCVISWSIFSLIGKTVMRKLSPLKAISYASLVGTICLFVPALWEGLLTDMGQYSPLDYLCLLYLGFFGTAIGFVWYYEGIKTIGPGAASQFINFVPICAVLLAFLILHEPLTPSLFVGMLCVSSGVYLMNSGARKN